MRTLILDNYDSFTYNLVHIVEQFTELLDVFRNDEIELNQIEEYDNVIISPGPGLPSEAGISIPLIKSYAEHKKILGVCLGMQAIVEAFQGELINLDEVMHGVQSNCIIRSDTGLFKQLPKSIKVGHYHSWAIDPDNVPENFDISAVNENGIIMALEHRELKLAGVQFHPESVLTPMGKQIIKNWMSI